MIRELKLESKNDTEDRILDYLLENASEALAEKINAGKKTLSGAMRYCRDEARKLKGGGDMVCVEDATVFGWVIHYFEEAELDEEDAPKAEPKAQVPAGVKPKAEKPARKPRKARTPDASAAESGATPEAAQTAQEPAPEVLEVPPAPTAAKQADDELPLFAAVQDGGQG